MPGANDQLANTPPGVDQASPREPDPVSPREPDPVTAQLRERMERLPPGHPSSPYNDDGSRKPPPPDLSAYELPIPGDSDYQPDALGAFEGDHARDLSRDYVHNHETPATSGGQDRELPPTDQDVLGDVDQREREERRLSQITDQVVEKCREAEGRDAGGNYGERGLSPAMRGIEAQAEHGKLVPETEKYALKTHDRFMEKLMEMVDAEPDKPAQELAGEIHDGIRYTFLFEPEDYIVGVRELTGKLEESGFELGVVKNTWGNDEYKGINTRWLDHESEVRFEVQFHTEESWTVKQQTHGVYVKIHNIDTPVEERERLRAYQREICARVLQPPGWEEIIDFRKEDW
jgi:hypothetical protein